MSTKLFKKGCFWYQIDEETGLVVRKTRYRPNALTLEVTPPTLLEAINSLDDSNDAHWTTQGLPAMKVLEELTQNAAYTRKDVRAVSSRTRRVRDADS